MRNNDRKYKVCIVDDELHARDVIKKYVKKLSGIELSVSETNNGLDAVELIISQKPDVLFLDIQMPELNGFEVLENIKNEVSIPGLIFTTAYDNFAIKAFEINAVDYLLKPFDFDRFNTAFERAMLVCDQKNNSGAEVDKLLHYWSAHKQTGEQSPATRLLVRENKKAFFVKTDSILYAEAANYYCTVFTNEGKKHLLTMTLGELEKKLDPQNFIRIHRSNIINLNFVKELLPHFNGEYIVIMQDGTKLKLSRNYKDNLSNLLL